MTALTDLGIPISYFYSGASRFINNEINPVSSVDNGIMYLQKQDLLEFCKFKLRRFSILVCSACQLCTDGFIVNVTVIIVYQLIRQVSLWRVLICVQLKQSELKECYS